MIKISFIIVVINKLSLDFFNLNYPVFPDLNIVAIVKGVNND